MNSRTLGWLILVFSLGGCFAPRPFPMIAAEIRPVTPPRLATREWAAMTHAQLRELLPPGEQNALWSDQLPCDVSEHFRTNGARLDSLIHNYSGIRRTAEAIPKDENHQLNDCWKEYREIAIPMRDGAILYGHLGTPTGADRGASYIVITHGLFGKQAGYDQRHLAEALRAFGHHVLAINMRGHGTTMERQPDVPMTFGLDEASDLLAVSKYLREVLGAKRVGLLAFSLTSVQGLMAAWIDGDATVSRGGSPIEKAQPTPVAPAEFNAGMLLVSPTLNLSDFGDQLEVRRHLIVSPIRTSFQDRIIARLKSAGAPVTHRMWGYVEYELRRSKWMNLYPDYDTLLADARRFIDFGGETGDWQIGAARLEKIRVPVLVLQAADDPVPGSAQAVAEVFGRTRNSYCGALILAGGGHTGFAPLSSAYYYSLMRAFFDPATGPAAAGA